MADELGKDETVDLVEVSRSELDWRLQQIEGKQDDILGALRMILIAVVLCLGGVVMLLLWA